MQVPLQITSRTFPLTPAIEEAIREKVDKLHRYYNRITGCHVTLELTPKGQHQGKIYQVRIDITVPGKEIVVNRNPDNDHSHEDLYVALRDAFDAAKRQLQDYVEMRTP